jgi:hypothetical protein
VPVAGSDARACARRNGRHFRRRRAAAPSQPHRNHAPLEPGTNIVCMLPIFGRRYLSTPLLSTSARK